MRAAAAAQDQGRLHEVLRWAQRLDSTSGAGAGWAFAAMAFEQRGRDPEAAAGYFERSLDIYVGQGRSDRAAFAGRGLLRCRWKMDDLRGAREAGDIAMREAKAANQPGLQAQIALDVAGILCDMGDYPAAWWAWHQAEALIPAGDTKLLAPLANNKGLLWEAEGRVTLAQQEYEKALKQARLDDHAQSARHALLSLAELAVSKTRPDEARRYLAEFESIEGPPTDARKQYALANVQAKLTGLEGNAARGIETLETALDNGPRASWRWRLQYERSRLLLDLGQTELARQALLESVNAVEGMRHAVDGVTSRYWTLARRRRPYEAWFSLEAEANDAHAALEVAERARGRSFLEAVRAGSDPAAGTAWNTDRVAERFDRRDRWQTLLDGGAQASWVSPPPLPRVLAALRDVDVLAYFDAGDDFWVASIQGGEIRLRRLSVPADEIDRRVAAWLALLDDEEANRHLAEVVLPSDWLPAPGRTLYLVTDGSLGQVPLGALWLGEQRLVERHPTSYVPSLSALAELMDESSGAVQGVVLLGDPKGDLTHARQELKSIADLLGVVPIVGEAVDEAALRGASDSQWLHVASHGGLDEHGAWLQLADGRFYAEQMLQMKLRPRGALLASCDTAARPGGGMWGSVAAALLAAGSEVVVAPLWSIDDATTRRFVERFYAEGGVDDPIGALARTKRSFIAADRPIEQWWSFVAVGVRHQPQGVPP